MQPISITAHWAGRVVILMNQKFIKQKVEVRTYETIYKYVENLNRNNK